MTKLVVIAAIGVALFGFGESATAKPTQTTQRTTVPGAPVWTGSTWMMPQPSPSSPSSTRHASGGSYEDQIVEACNYYGCDPNYLITVMNCESGGDQSAVAYNPVSGNYTYGIFQIDGMWGGGGMTPTEQIWFAAEHLTAGDIFWSCG